VTGGADERAAARSAHRHAGAWTPAGAAHQSARRSACNASWSG